MKDPKYYDPDYVDIGGLPSGGHTYPFTQIYMRQFVVRDYQLLHMGMSTKIRPHQHIIRAVQLATSVNIDVLTDGDFCYLMAWLRRYSFPELPLQARYTCMNPLWHDGEKYVMGISDQEARQKGYKREPCNHKQVEMVRGAKLKVHTLPDDVKIDDPRIDFARVSTLADYHEYVDDHPESKYLADLCRWVKQGTTFASKYRYLLNQPDNSLIDAIEDVRGSLFHGITENFTLRCGACGNKIDHVSYPSILHFFADNSEKDVFNMSYNLMSQFGVDVGLDTPLKKFLYVHSTLAHDRAEAEKQRKEKKRR